ncbi:MAG TPA: hypothetical protein VNG12_18575 [Acidimicrobiales bacterium]|nr:hypothetical protein [Acidimicrobiales bacterium]
MTTLPDPSTTPTIPVEDAAKLLGISRGLGYEQANRYVETGGTDGIPALRFGRRLVCPTARIIAMLVQA